jgi:YbgC/YbaW family acyl-CoA thioester hydrolase
MAHEFKWIQQVQFADTDMAGIVHFANFFRYMENAEHAFFRSLGFSIHTRIGEAIVGWPRVRATCEFKAPLRFEDEFEVLLTVREKKQRSLTYDFTFSKLSGDLVATGSLTAVCITLDEQSGRMKAAKIPDEIAAAIEAAPVDDA